MALDLPRLRSNHQRQRGGDPGSCRNNSRMAAQCGGSGDQQPDHP
jgi:hypothetical protein